MRMATIVLLVMLAASATATETPRHGEGDITKYDPRTPPAVTPEGIYIDEIRTKVFILVEGALLVPDRIRLHEDRDIYEIEVVDEDELDRFEPVAQFRFDEMLELNGDSHPRLAETLIRYEQKMWRKGLRVAFREYETRPGVRVRYTAFRVTFESSANVYRAMLTLYRAKTSTSQQLDAVVKALGELQVGLNDVRTEIKQAAQTVRTALDDLKKTMTALREQVNDLDKKVANLTSQVDTLERRLRRLQATQ